MVKKKIKEAFIDNKYLLLISVILFVFSLVLGFILGSYLDNIFLPVINQMEDELSSGVISVSFQSIFLNNILIVFRLFIFGVFFGGSVILLLYNGFFLGYFLAVYGDVWRNIIFILPHGVFELPSIVIATTSGLVLFKFIFKFVKDIVKNKIGFKDSLEKNSLILNQSLIILAIACILMFIAGIIEGCFTLHIANWLMNI